VGIELESKDGMWQFAGTRPAALGTLLRGPLDRLIASCSLVATSPVLDVRDFPWTALLRENWRAIREETEAARQHLPASNLIFGGKPVDETLSRCPVTASLVHQIPGLVNATVSTLAAGAHVPAHRGATKGLITCHLGLAVPRDGDVRMALANRVLRWAEGETLVFDDSYAHECWNEAGAPRTVLHLQFRRPMRQPARWLAERLTRR
jgi:beta-hydroxylase